MASEASEKHSSRNPSEALAENPLAEGLLIGHASTFTFPGPNEGELVVLSDGMVEPALRYAEGWSILRFVDLGKAIEKSALAIVYGGKDADAYAWVPIGEGDTTSEVARALPEGECVYDCEDFAAAAKLAVSISLGRTPVSDRR